MCRRDLAILLIVRLSLAATSVIAQPLGIDWSRSFGGSYSDWGVFVDMRPDNTYFVAGGCGLPDGDLADAAGQGTILLMGLDATGQLLWSKRIGGATTEEIFHGARTSDGNYVLVGRSTGSGGDIPENHGSSDALIVKVDPLGNIIWTRVFGTFSSDHAHHVAATSDGGCLVAGTTSCCGGNMATSTNFNDPWNYWVARLDADGNLVWQHSYGGSDADISYAIEPTQDGGSIVTGETYSNDGNVTTFHGLTDIWVVKLDAQGNIEWDRSYGGSGVDNGLNIRPTSDGGYLLLGWSTSTNGDIPVNMGAGDAWVAKLNATGDIVWARPTGGNDQDELDNAIEVFNGYLLAGSTRSHTGDATVNYGSDDVWLVRLDTDGNLLWQRTYGGSGSDAIPFLAQAGEDFVLTCWSTSSDLEVPHNHGDSDLWIAKLKQTTCAMGGLLYADLDQDAIPDTNEPPVAYRLVRLLNDGHYALSDSTGRYRFDLAGAGSYTDQGPDVPWYTRDPDTRSVIFSAGWQSDNGLDFRYVPMADINDLQVAFTALTPFRPGEPVRFDALYRNAGSVPTPAELRLCLAPHLTLDSVSVPFTFQNGDTLYWELDTLAVFAVGHITLYATVDSLVELGTPLTSTAHLDPPGVDAVPEDNGSSYTGYIIGSFDPNSIEVDRSSVEVSALPETTLEYLIRFQNTGTDTAFNVAVENTLPANADWSTFAFEGASAPVDVHYVEPTQRLRFELRNIDLPDSTTNEAASHGYIRYRLKPLTALSIGDQVRNTASICFDHNTPVTTNTAITTIVNTVGIGSSGLVQRVSLWPNPATDEVLIRSDHPLADATIDVRDALGRIWGSAGMAGTTHRFELMGLPVGLYFVSVRSAEGTIVRPLVKE